MTSCIDILACPFCKLGMDDLQARAMELSIYFLLVLIYSLMGIIVYKIWRVMATEERGLAREPARLKPEVVRPPGLEPGTKN